MTTTPNTVDQHIVSCLSISTKCDASQESAPATTITNTISIAQSGISLILGNAIAPNGVQLLSISGNNNDVYCAFGWNFQSLTATPHPTLDASSYTGTGSSAVVAISITGNGNHLHNCYLQGSYLKDTGTSPPYNMGDCIDVGSPTVGLATYGNSVENNLLQFCGAVGINLLDANQATVRDNYVVQSYDAGIQATVANIPAAAPSYKGEIANNWVQDTELKFNTYNAGAGSGNINIASPNGPSSGVGNLRGWQVHDNYVFNTSTLCNSNFGNPTHVNPSANDHGCSEGIQVTANPWDVHVYNNYVYNTGSEGIVLCMNNCSATGNYVGNAGQNCTNTGAQTGCGGILESVQNMATDNFISNTLVEGNTIWNDSTGGTTNNAFGYMGYCMWQNIGQAGTITNDNWVGNICFGTANSGGSSKPIVDGFKFSNSSATSSTIAGINLVDNTIDAGTVTTPVDETYAHTTGRVFHGFNNVYGTGSALASLPTPGDLAFFDPNSGTNGSYNLLDSGIAATNVALLSSPTFTGTVTAPIINATTGFELNGTTIQASAMLTAYCLGSIGTTAGTYVLTPATTAATSACNGATTAAEMPSPYQCVARNLYVSAGTAGSSGASGITTLYVNNSGTSLHCTLGTATTCSDVTDTVTLHSADKWSIRSGSSGVGETLANVRASFQCQ